MYDPIPVLEFYMVIMNLFLAAYLLKVLYHARKAVSDRAYAKMMNMMFIAIAVFFVVEILQTIFLGNEMRLLISPIFTMIFLLLLASTVDEMRKNVQAHEHLVKQRRRNMLSDVE